MKLWLWEDHPLRVETIYKLIWYILLHQIIQKIWKKIWNSLKKYLLTPKHIKVLIFKTSKIRNQKLANKITRNLSLFSIGFQYDINMSKWLSHLSQQLWKAPGNWGCNNCKYYDCWCGGCTFQAFRKVLRFCPSITHYGTSPAFTWINSGRRHLGGNQITFCVFIKQVEVCWNYKWYFSMCRKKYS